MMLSHKAFDEKKVLEESLVTLSRRRSNGGGVKYKIIDIDGSEMSLTDLLERYFFNENYYTSCSVVLTNLDKKDIEKSSITNDDSSPQFKYKYTKGDINNFFASDNGQKEKHSLEESICWPLIGKQSYKPFFLHCKMCPDVENINLISIDNHIRLKDPEKHKAKLLELLDKEEEEKQPN